MNEWLKNIIGFMLIISMTTQMLPNQKYEQYVRLVTGFLMILLVLEPILKIGAADVYIEEKLADFVEEQKELEESIGTESRKFQEEEEKMYEHQTNLVQIQEITRVEVTIDD